MSPPVKTIFIELRASADRLKADMSDAGTALDKVGSSGQAAGQKIAGGVAIASGSFGKLARAAGEAAVAVEGLLLVGAKYSGVAAASAGNTETLVNSYRGLRIALDPSIFTVASVAIGVLAEQTIRLTLARARLIEQQALIAARGGVSVGSIERSDTQASVSGGGANAGSIRSLQNTLQSRSITSPGAVSSGLNMLGVSGSATDPDMLAKIAQGFASIEDPAKRAEAAVRIFGQDNAGAALEQLNQRFAMGADAVNRYGLALNTLARTQIYQVRQEFESLKSPFIMLAEEMRASGEKIKSTLEQVAGAADDMSRRGMTAFDNWIRRIPGLEALAGAMQDLKSLSPGELAPKKSTADVQAGMQADDMFAVAQGAAARGSQTLEGRQAAQSAAQSRANSAYSSLDADSKKRQANPNDSSLLTGDQRFSLAQQQQSAQQLANAIGVRIASLQEAADAEKLAEQKAKELADFQAKAGERLDTLYQSSTTQGIKDPLARQMFEGRVEVQRDADRTTPAEKAGRAQIATGQVQDAAKAELLRNANAALAQQSRDSAEALNIFAKGLQKTTEDGEKHAEEQRKIDAAGMEGVRGGGEHGARMAEIQGQPGDEAQTAKNALNIRLQTVAAERAILDAHRESYTVAQGEVEDARLDKEAKSAELTYTEQLAERQKQLAQAALQTGGFYQQHLQAIRQEMQALDAVTVTSKNALDVETARVALNKQLLETQIAEAQATGKSAGNLQLQLATANAQSQLNQWKSMGPGTAAGDVVNSAMQVPASLGNALANGVMGGGKKGEDVGTQIAKAMKDIGLHLLGQLFTQMIEKLIATTVGQFLLNMLNNWAIHYASNPLNLFDEGGTVTHDQVAGIHAGEHVLTGDQVAGRAPLPSFLQQRLVQQSPQAHFPLSDSIHYASKPLNLFDEGGPVTHDQVAGIHAGEHVLTRDQVAGRAPLPSFLQERLVQQSPQAHFPSTEDYMSTGGSVVSPRDGDSYGGNHTFHIYENANARETARQVAAHLKTASPLFSKFAH